MHVDTFVHYTTGIQIGVKLCIFDIDKALYCIYNYTDKGIFKYLTVPTLPTMRICIHISEL
jgi:hypothetical protein